VASKKKRSGDGGEGGGGINRDKSAFFEKPSPNFNDVFNGHSNAADESPCPTPASSFDLQDVSLHDVSPRARRPPRKTTKGQVMRQMSSSTEEAPPINFDEAFSQAFYANDSAAASSGDDDGGDGGGDGAHEMNF
jgi:hypothetical protein